MTFSITWYILKSQFLVKLMDLDLYAIIRKIGSSYFCTFHYIIKEGFIDGESVLRKDTLLHFPTGLPYGVGLKAF